MTLVTMAWPPQKHVYGLVSDPVGSFHRRCSALAPATEQYARAPAQWEAHELARSTASRSRRRDALALARDFYGHLVLGRVAALAAFMVFRLGPQIEVCCSAKRRRTWSDNAFVRSAAGVFQRSRLPGGSSGG